MKKHYEKPQMYMESFEVSQYISGPCSIDVGFADYNANCKLNDKIYDVIYFIENSYCEQDPRPNASNGNNGICYHGATDPNAYFGS